ncbi:MAG: 4-(cytidine 5'-diphospho)-2-C-methyl-D-erythritol kinase [Campylobacterota bacterium]
MRQKAYAKVNIFLKITGLRGSYHELVSRFCLVPHLYDEIAFVPAACNRFTISGCGEVNTEDNTIYKAYRLLAEYTQSQKLQEFFGAHRVEVVKNIPSFAGLGGGSSDAAAFMHMCNKYCQLGLGEKTLLDLGAKVGADVPFFISGHHSANVGGIGEIITPFEEKPLDFTLIHPEIACSTPQVYQKFRRDYFKTINPAFAQKLESLPSAAILKAYDAYTLNDLFAPACDLQPTLKEYYKPGRFFSGSGSSFFAVNSDS